ncbi:uncharacterized protein CDAR_191751 [Caerostris darwini]|uniref:Uncharacterized protein n=1 Tax=Caerostris darwini TaxID=1538125 RepID=A0AAV4P9G9_9ARAC|nr:uncharacterized protein CDAR_191751 [Caerostris darwini]
MRLVREIEEGFKKFLDRPPEERAVQRDPFVYRDRDLHVNHCLRVIPDSFKEKIENALNDPKAIHSSQSVSNLRLLE